MGKDHGTPMRRCCGCMQSKPKAELIRICARDGNAFIDMEDKGSGRGAYLCRDAKCLEGAKRKNGFRRSIRGDIKPEALEKVYSEIEEMLKQ